MNIDELRQVIDKVDGELAALFIRRAGLCEAIGKLKKEQGLEVEDTARENSVINRLVASYGEDNRQAIEALYTAVFAYCKKVQQ